MKPLDSGLWGLLKPYDRKAPILHGGLWPWRLREGFGAPRKAGQKVPSELVDPSFCALRFPRMAGTSRDRISGIVGTSVVLGLIESLWIFADLWG